MWQMWLQAVLCGLRVAGSVLKTGLLGYPALSLTLHISGPGNSYICQLPQFTLYLANSIEVGEPVIKYPESA